jgi:Family of unknown function (DUF6328)
VRQRDDMTAPDALPARPPNGRNETELERCDRNLVELLQEVRVVLTGVQVLFGFLLMAPLTAAFGHLSPRQHAEYYVSFAVAGLAAFLLIAPTAYHRVLFRRGDKEYLVAIANRLTIAGLCAVGISMATATIFVTDVLLGEWSGIVAGILAGATIVALWAILPLARRRELNEQAPQLAAGSAERIHGDPGRTVGRQTKRSNARGPIPRHAAETEFSG